MRSHTHANQLETEICSGTMTRFTSVSDSLSGAYGIRLAIATIPSGCPSSPHLEQELIIKPGNLIYVPANAAHQPVNDSDSPMELIAASNTPVEIVEEYHPRSNNYEIYLTLRLQKMTQIGIESGLDHPPGQIQHNQNPSGPSESPNSQQTS